jgi:hypothetical protein
MTETTAMRLLAGLARVRDDQLRGAVDSPVAQALLREIVRVDVAPARGRRRRRLLHVAAAGAAAASLAVAVLVGTRGHETPTASAATLLKHTAKIARAQPPLALGAGQYVYTRSRDVSAAVTVVGGSTFAALEPHSREIWLNAAGNGRLHTVTGQPTFITERDRAAWIAAGRPQISTPGAHDDVLHGMPRVEIPTDPDRAYAQLKRKTAAFGAAQYTEMFTLVGDNLRETTATPEQRAALYAVAARIPGVESLGPAVDPAGRRGVAVAMDDAARHIRQTLIFDPATSRLLAEQEIALSGSQEFPAGTRIESAVYLETAIVDSAGERPAR